MPIANRTHEAKTFSPRTILVAVAVGPTDDTAVAEHLVDAACDLAKPIGARLTLVHVAAPSTPIVPVLPEAPGAYIESLQAALALHRDWSRRALDALAERARGRGLDVVSRMRDADGSVGEALVAAAVDEGAGLIALSSHGRRGLPRLLLGSVADRVAHLSTVPVLLFHAADAR